MKLHAKYVRLLAESSLKLLLVLSLVVLVQPFAVARRQTPVAQVNEMRKLDFLLGEWKGKGWRYVYRGGRSEYSQSVKVKNESGGSVLRARDARTYKDNGLLGSVPSSMMTIYYDEGAKLYRLSRDSVEGRKHPFELKLIEPETLQWEKQTPAGLIRTTIKITEASEWHETLEVWNSVDGWYKAEESVLKRVK